RGIRRWVMEGPPSRAHVPRGVAARQERRASGSVPVFYRALTRETPIVLRSGGDKRSSAGRNGGAAGGAVAPAGGPDGRRRRVAHPFSRPRARPTAGAPAPAAGRLRRGEPCALPPRCGRVLPGRRDAAPHL